MLVLARRIGQTIRINDDIRITVIDIGGNKCRLGIQAPANVPVAREELIGEEGMASFARRHGEQP